MHHFILAFLLISLSGFSQTISKQVVGPVEAATFERGLSTSLCEGSSGNQLVNPSFEVPSVTNIGNNFLTWPINGWNGVGSAPNFVKVNGVAGQGGPISAQEGVQYLDIIAGSADFYQEFDFQCNTQVFFSGYFSVRDGLTSTGRIDILRVNSDNTTDIVASSNQLNMPSTANIWYLASGDAVLPAGNYRFNISMGNNSNFDSACFSFDDPNIDAGSYGPLCESSSITLTGTPTDSFGSWTGSGIVDNGDGTASFNPSGLGGTTVTVTYSHFDASGFGCSQSTNIEVNPNITPTFTQVPAICSGDALSELLTTSNNGITGTWSPSLDTTTTTTYTFTPDTTQSGQACVFNETMTIVVNPNVTPTFTQIPAICSGDALSDLLTTSNNGITGTWSPALDNTTTTTYAFTPDADQCATAVNMTIAVNPNVTPTFTQVPAICSGDALSDLLTTSNNGITGTWSPSLDTTATTTYAFTPDAGQCAATVNMTIAVNPNVTPTFTQVAAIFNGETLGALPTTSNNGVTGTWSPAINNTETTTYTFTPDDSEACAVNQTMTISVNTIPFSVAVNSEIICSSGIATLVATPSPAGFYSYTWIVPEGVNNPGNVQSFSTSIEGDYSVSISKDNYLCNTDFEENQLGILGSYSIVHQDTVPCWETTASDSQIEVWGDEMNGIDAYSGNQFIELNANMQSTLFQNFEIILGSPVILSFAHRGRNSSADDIMEVEIGPIGGPYVNLGAFSDGVDSWGYYSLEYVLPNDLGINYTIRFKSIQPAGSLGNFLDDISVVFSSDVSSEIATGNVSIITEITPTFTQIPAICSGDALSDLLTTSNNGITGTWSPSLDTTTTTTYTFTPDTTQSGQACAVNETMTIVVNPNITPTFTQIPAICSGDALSDLLTTSNNGITGTWSPSLDTTTTTTYTFTPAADQCGTAVNMTIAVNPNVTPTFTQIPEICSGDALSELLTTSNNGITGAWSPSLDTTTTTTYTFTPDADQCGTVVNMTITVNPNVIPTFTQIPEICDGDALAVLPTTSNDGITGTWSPALDNTTTTTYTFTPTARLCANSATLIIVVNPIVDPVFDAVDAICDGAALVVLPTTSNDGITGTWSPSLDNTTTTTYTFTPNLGECANPATLIIVVNPIVDAVFDAVDAICDGDFLATLPTTSNNGVSGTWSPALDNTITTTYTFTPDLGECANPATLIIVVNPLVDPVFDAVDAICDGDALAVLPTTSNNGITGTWSPALDNTTTTTYTFTPTARLCANPATLTIVVNPKVNPLFTAVDAICDGDFLAALPTTSNDGVTGTWSPALDNTTTTTYTFTPNAGECADPTLMTVVVIPVNVLTISAINLSEEFDTNQVISVTVSGGSGSYEYQLDNGLWQFSSVFEYVTGCGEHTVVVRDAIDTCNTEPETSVSIMEYPKLFTPNGDGFNDTWNIKCLKDNPLARIRIYDRFGKLLLDFRPSQNAWNGTFNGQRLPGTDYWFVANYLNSNGLEAQLKSHFSLRY